MDDPWGSPWASADHNQETPQLVFDLSPDPKPPQPAVLANNAHALSFSSLPEQSPWADDDDNAFGDWATADPPGNTAGTSPSWAGAPTHEGFEADHRLSPLPRDKLTHGGQLSPIALPSSAALSPAASPGLSPGKGSQTRLRANVDLSRSPNDPWNVNLATVDSEAIREGAAAVSREKDIPTLRLDESRGAGDVQSTHMPAAKVTDSEGVPGNVGEAPSPQETSTDEGGLQPADTREAALEARSTGDISRPSSSGSDDSHHINPRQDSPTTSIEDDSKSRPPFLQRKSTPKVQDLVELFDGLSKTPAQNKLSVSDSVSTADLEKSLVGPPETLPVELDLHVPESPASESTLIAPLEEHTRPPATRRGSTQDSDNSPPPPDHDTGGPTVVHPLRICVANLLDKFGRGHYSLDRDKIDEFFSGDTLGESRNDRPRDDTEDENRAALDSYVPDYILVNSFTSISERKAWYRISRQGSYRKHNAGDDENYRPVMWAASTVRAETVKIVRRWMEEDSFTGKPTLGGSGVRGNLFGWNSAAEPVTLDEVFKKKSNGRLSASYQVNKQILSSPTSSWGEADKEAFSPASVFGWGEDHISDRISASKTGLTRSRTQLENYATRTMMRSSPSISVPHRAPSNPLQPSLGSFKNLQPFKSAAASSAAVRADVSNTEDVDDGEWGEMISSPTDGGGMPLPLAPLQAAAFPEDDPATYFIDSIIRGLPNLSYMTK